MTTTQNDIDTRIAEAREAMQKADAEYAAADNARVEAAEALRRASNRKAAAWAASHEARAAVLALTAEKKEQAS